MHISINLIKSILNGLENLGQFDLGFNAPLNIPKTEHQASHQIWSTIIRKGDAVPFDLNLIKNMP